MVSVNGAVCLSNCTVYTIKNLGTHQEASLSSQEMPARDLLGSKSEEIGLLSISWTSFNIRKSLIERCKKITVYRKISVSSNRSILTSSISLPQAFKCLCSSSYVNIMSMSKRTLTLALRAYSGSSFSLCTLHKGVPECSVSHQDGRTVPIRAGHSFGTWYNRDRSRPSCDFCIWEPAL